MDPEVRAADLQLTSVLTPLLPRIEKAVAQLRAVTNLNRNVHMAHYNRIISEGASMYHFNLTLPRSLSHWS